MQRAVRGDFVLTEQDDRGLLGATNTTQANALPQYTLDERRFRRWAQRGVVCDYTDEMHRSDVRVSTQNPGWLVEFADERLVDGKYVPISGAPLPSVTKRDAGEVAKFLRSVMGSTDLKIPLEALEFLDALHAKHRIELEQPQDAQPADMCGLLQRYWEQTLQGVAHREVDKAAFAREQLARQQMEYLKSIEAAIIPLTNPGC